MAAMNVRKPRDRRAQPADAGGMMLDHDACYRAICARDARFDGRLFIGVLTTGIYCRPICPARTPLSRNVTFYPTAAAAQEAGFRPCLRCRPETAPDLAAWRGTSNTVQRALRLIEMGALDDGDVDGLAARLGVGERHLRRLFKQHLGAAPVSVAQTRRVLLAKQLIHETSLPMTEIALASGFGSVRRFNETFAQLYGRPPGELRRRGGPAISAAHGITVRLPYRAPYDWDGVLEFFRARAIEGVERVEAGRYARTISLDGEHGVIVVEPAEGDALSLTVRFPKLSALPAIIARVRRMFDLAADPAAIGDHLSGDESLRPMIAARPGLRLPGAWDGFEQSVRAILGQQITVTAAINLAGVLTRAHGEPLRAPILGLTHLFPSPARIAASDLPELKMPGARKRALSSLARAAIADPSLFNGGADLEESLATLRALPGVGEWTAQYIAMRALREPDAFPAADVALMRAMEESGARPNAKDLTARAEAWRPWRAYAAQHLWASLTPAAQIETRFRLASPREVIQFHC